MRVTHIITRLIVGGAQENTIASVLGLSTKPDLSADLISGPTTGAEGSLEPLVKSTPGLLTIIPELVRPVSPWKDLIAYRKLVTAFRDRRPDIVHTHSGKAGVLGRLAASRARVPVIIHTVHGPSFGPFQGSVANLVFRSAERRAATVTHHFVAVAEAMKNQYLAAGIGSADKFSVIYSGFDLAPYTAAMNDLSLRGSLGIGEADIVIGKVARLFALKGHDDLLEIAPELVRAFPTIKFLLVGDGPWRERFEQKARVYGLERHVTFTGLVPPTRVPALTSIMDVLVHLSRREGLARAIPQAAASCKPVVAYDCDGASEACLDGVTGFLVKPGDLQHLKQRLLALASDGDLRNRMGQKGRELACSRFDVASMVDGLYSLYLNLTTSIERQPRR